MPIVEIINEKLGKFEEIEVSHVEKVYYELHNKMDKIEHEKYQLIDLSDSIEENGAEYYLEYDLKELNLEIKQLFTEWKIIFKLTEELGKAIKQDKKIDIIHQIGYDLIIKSLEFFEAQDVNKISLEEVNKILHMLPEIKESINHINCIKKHRRLIKLIKGIEEKYN